MLHRDDNDCHDFSWFPWIFLHFLSLVLKFYFTQLLGSCVQGSEYLNIEAVLETTSTLSCWFDRSTSELHRFFIFHMICFSLALHHAFISLSCLIRSSATWPLEPSTSEKKGWRYIRLQQMGKNASGQTHYLSLSGFELYGTVTGVVEENLSKYLGHLPCFMTTSYSFHLLYY